MQKYRLKMLYIGPLHSVETISIESIPSVSPNWILYENQTIQKIIV